MDAIRDLGGVVRSFGACIERRRRLDRVIFRVHSLPSDPFSLGGPTREKRTRDRDIACDALRQGRLARESRDLQQAGEKS